MKSFIFLCCSLLCLQITGCSQNKNKTSQEPQKKVGGNCEGCEAIYETAVPFKKLNAIDTLPDFNESGPKIKISGIVYERDGKTPAKDVVIYVYHTDQAGRYTPKENSKEWGKRHGYIRGWMKTDEHGFYEFYTLRPASYPNSNIPQHIHVTVKEPDKNEYWIDEYLFEDDPFLTESERKKQEKRGGSGIVTLKRENGMLQAKRYIILGLNIPGY